MRQAIWFPILLAFTCGAQESIPAADARPTLDQQTAMLAAMAGYAERYVSNLPNFVCELTTEQYRSGSKHEHWKKLDALTSQLTFSEGREHFHLQLVNHKPLRGAYPSFRRPLITEGEFGQLLQRVFSDSSNASFDWKGWETLEGRKLAAFTFNIDREHSTLKLSLSDLASAIVPYQGAVYADPKTGAVWRISDIATEIPSELRMDEIGTTVDYGQIKIGDSVYLLPVHATVLMKTDTHYVRNELSFREYRKFEAESSIKFDSDSSSPQER